MSRFANSIPSISTQDSSVQWSVKQARLDRAWRQAYRLFYLTNNLKWNTSNILRLYDDDCLLGSGCCGLSESGCESRRDSRYLEYDTEDDGVGSSVIEEDGMTEVAAEDFPRDEG
jgi:hypothetical protein